MLIASVSSPSSATPLHGESVPARLSTSFNTPIVLRASAHDKFRPACWLSVSVAAFSALRARRRSTSSVICSASPHSRTTTNRGRRVEVVVSAATSSNAQGTDYPERMNGVDKFRKFLLDCERDIPLWYTFSDLYLTVVGAFCFYASVVEPDFAVKNHLLELEDIINVNFFIKFVLLYWSNDFKNSWFFTGKAQLDLFSCLPVLSIVARGIGGPTLEKTIDLLQLSRFFRLLRESLPTSSADRPKSAQSPLQVTAVFIALFGTLALSATLLLLYENTDMVGPSAARDYEDAVLFMINVFSGRQTAFDPATAGGKRVTVAATVVGIFFLPFLIRSSFAGGFFKMDKSPQSPQSPQSLTIQDGPVYWAGVLQRVDDLEKAKRISLDEGKELRRECLEESRQLQTLDLCYGLQCVGSDVNQEPWSLYAGRLQEWLQDGRVEDMESRIQE